MKNKISFVLRWGISIACLVYAFYGVPLKDLWDAMKNLPVLPMVLTVVTAFIAYAVLGLRLKFMHSPSLKFKSTFYASLVGLALNNILPAKAGEIAKAVWIKNENNLSFDISLGLVFMERFFDVNILALLSLWFMFKIGMSGAANVLIICLIIGWAILILFHARPEFLNIYNKLHLPLKLADFLTRFTKSLISQLYIKRLIWMTFSTFLLWSFYYLQTAIALDFAAKLNLGFAGTLGVFALSSLGMLLPSSPGAIGVYEAVAVTALTAYNVPREQALAITLFIHMAQFIPVTLAGGLIFLAFPDAHKDNKI